ncbi:MAG: hypothetical protein VX185_15015 [Pseudomonadota bacterium]|nr:hypothetical protein [Pseudomonadota bacterium]
MTILLLPSIELDEFSKKTNFTPQENQLLHQFLTESQFISDIQVDKGLIQCSIESVHPKLINYINYQLQKACNTNRLFYIKPLNDNTVAIDSKLKKAHSPVTMPTIQTLPSDGCSLHFPKATTEDISTQGKVTEVKPGLYVGKRVTKDNRCVYFGRESYLSEHSNAVDFVERLPSSFQSAQQKIDITFKQRQMLQEARHAFSGELLSFEKSINRDGPRFEDKHLVYISTKPIVSYIFPPPNTSTANSTASNINTDKVAAVVTSSTSPELDRSVLRGICKTPKAIIENLKVSFEIQDKKIGLGVALQHFAMQCSLKDGMHYCTFSPMSHMNRIFRKEITPTPSGMYTGFTEIDQYHLTDKIGPTAAYNSEEPFVFNLSQYKNPIWTS